MRIPIVAAVLLLAVMTAAAHGQASLNTIGEKNVAGRLLSIERESLVFQSESKGKTAVPIAEVVSVVFSDAPGKGNDSDVEIELHNGDVFFGELNLKAAEGQALSLRDRSAGCVVLPDLGLVKWIRFPAARGRRLETGREPASDFVFQTNGDRISGTIDSITPAGVAVERSGETKTIPLSDLLGVYVAPLVPVKPRENVYAVFVLRNGCCTHGDISSFKNGIFTLAPGFGKDLEIPAEEVLNVSFRNGRFAYLSDADPVEIVEIRHLFDDPTTVKPPFDAAGLYNYRKDRSYDGNPITLGGKRFYKGVGSHSYAEIKYDLRGGFVKFEAVVGIDDEVLPRPEKGSVIFRVKVDGVEKAATQAMKGGMAPVRLSVDLTGASSLSLVVD